MLIMWVIASCSGTASADMISNPFPGVTLTEREFATLPTLYFQEFVLQIDLATPGLRFEVTEPNGGLPAGTETDLETTLDFVLRKQAQIGINANYFDNSAAAQSLGSTDVLGISSSNGNTYSAGHSGFNRVLDISRENVASIQTLSSGTPAGLYNAVAGFTIVTGGVPQGANGGSRANRTAVGLDTDTDTLLFVVSNGGFLGRTNFETAATLVEFGASEGIMLDRGGSSGLVIDYPDDLLGARELIDSNRRVGNSLIVYVVPEPATWMTMRLSDKSREAGTVTCASQFAISEAASTGPDSVGTSIPRVRGIADSVEIGSLNEAMQHVHPDDRIQLKSYRDSLIQGRAEGFSLDYRVQATDGSWVWLEERTRSIRNPDGEVIRLSGCEVEITERKLKELSLEEEHRANSELPVAVCRFERQQCVGANEVWSQLAGRPAESAIGDGWLDAIHPDDLEAVLERRDANRFGPAGEDRIVDGLEGRYVLPDGSITWILAKLHLRYDADGELEKQTVVVVDISARKTLEQHHERLIAILEASTDYIGIATPPGDILWQNKPLSELRDHVERRVADEHPEWAMKLLETEAIPTAIETGSWSGKSALLDGEGKEIPVSQVVLAHRNADGELQSFSTIMRDISAQEAVERTLRERERTFSSLAAAVPVAIFRMSELFQCVYVNQRWAEFSQRPVEAALGNGWMKFVHPDDLKRLKAHMRVFAKDPAQVFLEPFQVRKVMPDGSTRWVLCHAAKELDEAGNVTGYAGAISDLDQVKRVEAELQQANERLRKVLEFSAIGTWEWSYVEQTHSVDEQSAKIFGVDQKDFPTTYEGVSQFIHPDDFERVTATWGSATTNERGAATEEFRIVRPGGQVRHIYASIFVERDEHDRPVRAVGMHMDITDLKQTEIALQESMSRMERMTENVPGMIYTYVARADGSEALTFVSSTSTELFGVDPRQARGNISNIWEVILPVDAGRVREALRLSSRMLQPLKQDFRVNHPQRGLLWLQTSGHPRRTDEGDTIWDGVVIDITDRKQAHLKLQLANDELAKATQAKDQFLANMNHEMRTPLSVMLGTTEGLQQGVYGNVSDKQRDGLKLIEQSGNHLLQLINETLDLAKIELGQIDLQLAAVNVSQLCESSLRMVALQAGKKSIQLNLGVPKGLPDIEADENRLRQVLINLLGNAIKFSPERGRVSLMAERVEPTDKVQKELLRISVTDTGIGIHKTHIESIFEPFVQTDTSLSRDHEGTGLGLALVKKFIELHAGNVSVSSEPGEGSCFTIDLPFRQAVTSPRVDSVPNVPAGLLQMSDCAESAEPASVLLTEDNDGVAESVVLYLETMNFEVTVARDGIAAIEAAKRELPDVILMDIQLPRLDGYEAIRRIRGIPSLEKTPIIALTGRAMPQELERCLDAGADLSMSKPYQMLDLVHNMRQLLASQAK
ncbi:unnamed protein product [Cladocopium goreaui]|uniref:histidine kinase n=1 Tax=Cladocopium goreaui TaxID=2562237 RepID=A0A9P1BGM6_9DINO|nr:unnamed protein product [Cladocopium goreaui]